MRDLIARLFDNAVESVGFNVQKRAKWLKRKVLDDRSCQISPHAVILLTVNEAVTMTSSVKVTGNQLNII